MKKGTRKNCYAIAILERANDGFYTLKFDFSNSELSKIKIK